MKKTTKKQNKTRSRRSLGDCHNKQFGTSQAEKPSPTLPSVSTTLPSVTFLLGRVEDGYWFGLPRLSKAKPRCPWDRPTRTGLSLSVCLFLSLVLTEGPVAPPILTPAPLGRGCLVRRRRKILSNAKVLAGRRPHRFE